MTKTKYGLEAFETRKKEWKNEKGLHPHNLT